jgi:hypothetical protein
MPDNYGHKSQRTFNNNHKKSHELPISHKYNDKEKGL